MQTHTAVVAAQREVNKQAAKLAHLQAKARPLSATAQIKRANDIYKAGRYLATLTRALDAAKAAHAAVVATWQV